MSEENEKKVTENKKRPNHNRHRQNKENKKKRAVIPMGSLQNGAL